MYIHYCSDHKLKVWNIASLLDDATGLLFSKSNDENEIQVVRWSPDGDFIATGDSGSLVRLWGMREAEHSNGSFNNDSNNTENWKCIVTFRGHTMDVTGLAWSPDSSYIASCSIDNSIRVWLVPEHYHTISLPTIETTPHVILEKKPHSNQGGHESWVKDVSWDPVGRYLASVSDDKSVIIWRCADWKQEAKLQEPFLKSKENTPRRRQISWSPDGAFVCVSHAYEPPKHVAYVIERNQWNDSATAVRLVGHTAPVSLVSFSPAIYERQQDIRSTVVAIACQKGTLSLWSPGRNRPLVICKGLFAASQISDIQWSPDGSKLFLCSIDGNVVCIKCDHFRDHPSVGTAMSKQDVQRLMTERFGDLDVRASEPMIVEGPAAIRLEASVVHSAFAPSTIVVNQLSARRIAPTPQVNVLQPRRKGDPIPKPVQQQQLPQPDASSINQPQIVETQTNAPRATVVVGRPAENKDKVFYATRMPSKFRKCIANDKNDLKIFKVLRKEPKGRKTTLETEVSLIHNDKVVWKSYINGKLVAIAGNNSFCAALSKTHQLHLFGMGGQLLVPALQLPGTVACVAASPDSSPYLLVVFCDGRIRVWNVPALRCEVSDAFIDPLFVDKPDGLIRVLSGSPMHQGLEGSTSDEDEETQTHIRMANVSITQHGTAMVQIVRDGTSRQAYNFGEECAAFAYSDSLKAWARVSDPREFRRSKYYSTLAVGKHDGMLYKLQNQLIAAGNQAGLTSTSVSTRAQEMFEFEGDTGILDSQSRNHLESLMQSSLVIGSVEEYKIWVAEYTRTISDDVTKLTAFCDSFLGPFSKLNKMRNKDEDLIESILKPALEGDAEITHALDITWESHVLGKVSKHDILKEIIIPTIVKIRNLQNFAVVYEEALSALSNGCGVENTMEPANKRLKLLDKRMG